VVNRFSELFLREPGREGKDVYSSSEPLWRPFEEEGEETKKDRLSPVFSTNL
jgi:hypothetical protein